MRWGPGLWSGWIKEQEVHLGADGFPTGEGDGEASGCWDHIIGDFF